MKLLDRLMARQARLLANLDDPRPREVVDQEHSQTASARLPSPSDPAAEAAAREEAASRLAAGDLAAARAVLQPFATAGTHVGTFTTLARICTEQGDFAAALAALQRAEALDPADRKVWRLTAKLLTAQKRHREALVYLRRLALVDPDAPASTHVDLLRGLFRTVDRGEHSVRAARASQRELEGVLKRFEAAPGGTDELRLQFAGLYYTLTRGSPEALRIYNTAARCPPTHRDVTAKLVKLERWCTENKLAISHTSADDEVAEKRQPVYSLTDAQIHPALGWIPVLDGGRAVALGHRLQAKHFRGINPLSPLMLFRGTHAELRVPRDLPVQQSRAVLVGGSASYYETVVSDLSGLAVAESAGLDRTLPLVVRANMRPFQRELLALLGYGDTRLIEVTEDRPMQFERLYVPGQLAEGSRPMAPLVGRWYRTRLAKDVAAPSRRLYVAPGPEVSVQNAEALALLMHSLGFEAVEPTTLSVRAQIDRFSHASHVVGATSESLTNVVFSTPGIKLLELRPVHWAASGGHLHFETLAGACAHQYVVQECVRTASDSAETIAIVVDLGQVASQLKDWL